MEEHTDCIETYKKVRVNTAHPMKIVVMLYDEALKQIDIAVHALAVGVASYDKANNAMAKAKDIFTELTIALDMEQGGDIAKHLFRLYDFFGDQLSAANHQKKADPLEKIRPLVAELRESWAKICHEKPQDAVAAGGVDISG